ncbi:glycosyltransferase [Flavobacterium agricola]|uniref:Glycosyltransferase n=1 Tax=Flavobacterium agricola TaxID=2870839 RepID=A0ABY6M375_9FLAO|nr:glycosyltransferase [Flavobacterium agricola]UYW01656.1 glycosyltransferase [Flavobacterium agricola]
MFLDILLYIFIGIIVLQFIYYIGIFSVFSFKKAEKKNPNHVPVSVIVCAKNEAENVTRLIPELLNQNYPDFEIILIDDASSDETLEIFEEFEKQHSKIRLVKVENNEAFWGNKKYALTLGIKTAKKPYLLFTDADCFIPSNQWIAEMTAHFTEKKTIVLGYGKYKKIKGSLLNKLIRYETLLTAIQYFSWAKKGKPYMGVGRNLAYNQSEFYKVNGFIDHMSIRSGDDDLFINQAATKNNTEICYSLESFTISEPKTTFNSWYRQKRRHVSTASHYKFFDKAQLALFYACNISFFILAIVLLVTQHQWILVTALIAFRYLFTWISVGCGAGKLHEKDVVYWYPFLEVTLIFTQFSVFIHNKFSKPVHWK